MPLFTTPAQSPRPPLRACGVSRPGVIGGPAPAPPSPFRSVPTDMLDAAIERLRHTIYEIEVLGSTRALRNVESYRASLEEAIAERERRDR